MFKMLFCSFQREFDITYHEGLYQFKANNEENYYHVKVTNKGDGIKVMIESDIEEKRDRINKMKKEMEALKELFSIENDKVKKLYSEFDNGIQKLKIKNKTFVEDIIPHIKDEYKDYGIEIISNIKFNYDKNGFTQKASNRYCYTMKN